MAESDMPSHPGRALRWVLGGIALFVFFLLWAEDINTATYGKAWGWAAAFAVTFVILLFWPKLAAIFGSEQTAAAATFHHRDAHPVLPAPSAGEAAPKWVPDWPIRNLFFCLKSDLQQTKNRADFDALADEIIDKLSTGQILSWGRAIGEARTLPLFPIPDDYWLHAKLNIWLLDDDGGDILQASPVSLSAPNKTQYREILINRAQALAEWPKIAVPVERDTKLGDALAYVVTGNWDRKALWENEGGAISAAGSALKEFEQLASDGVLQVWGMRTRNLGPHVKIPSEYWETHHVHYMSLFKESADASSYVSVSQEPDYFDLKVSKAQFEVRWPR